jgi:hypothetical protein
MALLEDNGPSARHELFYFGGPDPTCRFRGKQATNP